MDDVIGARVALAEKTGTFDTALPALAEEARRRARAKAVMLTVAVAGACFLVVVAMIGKGIVDGAQGYFDAIDTATKE